MSTSDPSFQIQYPAKDGITVGPGPELVYGVSIYRNHQLIALLRSTDNDPAKVWMGRPPEREPEGDSWMFLFGNVPPCLECSLEVWCIKTQELMDRRGCLHTGKSAERQKREENPKLNGPVINRPVHGVDDPLPSQFGASGTTDDIADGVSATMSSGGTSVDGLPMYQPNQYSKNWGVWFNMGQNHGAGWTLTVNQGAFSPTSPNLQVGSGSIGAPSSPKDERRT